MTQLTRGVNPRALTAFIQLSINQDSRTGWRVDKWNTRGYMAGDPAKTKLRFASRQRKCFVDFWGVRKRILEKY